MDIFLLKINYLQWRCAYCKRLKLGKINPSQKDLL